MITLHIDTATDKGALIKIIEDGKTIVHCEEIGPHKSQSTLLLIKKSLQDNGIKLSDISEIEVNIGPGSFTGTRVGVAIANALGFALGVSVNSSPVGNLVFPRYETSKFGS